MVGSLIEMSVPHFFVQLAAQLEQTKIAQRTRMRSSILLIERKPFRRKGQ